VGRNCAVRRLDRRQRYIRPLMSHMNARLRQLKVLTDLVEQFELSSLRPTVQACAALAQEGLIDVAVLGQFKSGKSSLLNTILGESLFPVGVLPVTAVVTRVMAGPQLQIRVTHLDGSVELAEPASLSAFVTESANPGNQKQVSVVDVFVAVHHGWTGLRFVDTPGLGSVFAHNTEATHVWMPSASVALVVVSAERPFSEADRQLVTEARQTAPRVVVVLNKVDLLSDSERTEVIQFIERALRDAFGNEIPVLSFSSRVEPDRWAAQIREAVIAPVAANVIAEGERALALKLDTAGKACQGYLMVALAAAERTDSDRERLRTAIFTETVGEALIRDELALATQRVCQETRTAFEKLFFRKRAEIERRVGDRLAAELPTWQGNMAVQIAQYGAWMDNRLRDELALLTSDALPAGADLLAQAEIRFQRILAAFRDRLSQNIQRETGITVSSVSWQPNRPELTTMPVSVSNPFMTNWELLWWLLPMGLVGGLFWRHVLGLVPREVEKNLFRLVSDWSTATDAAIASLETQATSWIEAELATLNRLVQQQSEAVPVFRNALERLSAAALVDRPRHSGID